MAETHEKLFFILRKMVKNKKKLSTGAFIDMILYGYHWYGVYPQWVARNHEKLMEEMMTLEWLILDKRHRDAIRNVLSQNVCQCCLNLVKDARAALPDTYDYLELSQGRDWDQRFQKIVTSNFDKAANIFFSFARPFKNPIYIDTEHCYETLPYGGKEALLTFCDFRSRRILLWRIHEYDWEQVEEIKSLVRFVGETRQFASFGKERFFEGIPIKNLQYNRQSLQAYGYRIRTEIKKTETWSDWTVPVLRNDQIQYAAWDAWVLHYIKYQHNTEFGPWRRRYQ